MTLALELGGIADPVVRRALEEISKQFPLRAENLGNDVMTLTGAGTKRRVAFGVTTCTFTASAGTPLVTVNHGLGTTPASVIVSCGAGSGGETDCWSIAANLTASTLQVTANGTTVRTATVPVYWVAIG